MRRFSVGECLVLTSDVDNTFSGSTAQNNLFEDGDKFYGDIDGIDLIYPENQSQTGNKVIGIQEYGDWYQGHIRSYLDPRLIY